MFSSWRVSYSNLYLYKEFFTAYSSYCLGKITQCNDSLVHFKFDKRKSWNFSEIITNAYTTLRYVLLIVERRYRF